MKNKNEIIKLVLYAVALAMGVATVVLSVVGESLELETIAIFLGIAVFCLALAGLDSVKTNKL